MKKIIITTFIFVVSIGNSFSQDLITKKNGEDVKAKVTEITLTEVKYKRFDNLNGPIYSMDKSEILLIKYENGVIDVMPTTPVRSEIKQNESGVNAINIMDALKNGSISDLGIEAANNTLTITIDKKDKESALSCIIPSGKTKIGFIENEVIRAGGIGTKRISGPAGTSIEFFSFFDVDNLDTEGFSLVMDESLMINIPAGEYSKMFTIKGNLNLYIPEKYTGLILTGLSGNIISGKITVKRNDNDDKEKRTFEIKYGNMKIKGT